MKPKVKPSPPALCVCARELDAEGRCVKCGKLPGLDPQEDCDCKWLKGV
jgi:hypothetical protein